MEYHIKEILKYLKENEINKIQVLISDGQYSIEVKAVRDGDSEKRGSNGQ